MSENEKLEIFSKSTDDIIQLSLQNLLEGFTGLASSSRKEAILSIGHVLQRLRSGHFLTALQKEWNVLREKGKIKEDYEYSEEHYKCLAELLDFLDSEFPDEDRFNILKKIFIIGATKNLHENTLPYHYLRIARKLSGGEILILFANYSLYLEPEWKYKDSAPTDHWLSQIEVITKLSSNSLIEIYEESLIEKKLITSRGHNDNSLVNYNPYHRFTDLGLKICEFVSLYENEV